jgi:hypothetical protein
MVQVTSNSPVNIESILAITEGQAEAIKANPKRMKALCKDFHVCHTIAQDENGNIVSKIFRPITNNEMIKEYIKELEDSHAKILLKVDGWEKEMECEECEQQDTHHQPKEENSSEQEESKEEPLTVLADQVHDIVGDTPSCLLLLDSEGHVCISGTIPLPMAACIIARYAR